MVVAGQAGLDNDVNWPVALRVRPPAFEPLAGHELALVSIEALRLLDESLSLAQLIERLAARGVAGVVVIGDADLAARRCAEARNLPLLCLPGTEQLADLAPALSRVIADRRSRLYQLGLDVQYQLAEMSMTGRGLRGIVGRLAGLAEREVLLVNPNGEALVSASPTEGALAGGVAGIPVAALRDALPGDAVHQAEPSIGRLVLPTGPSLATTVVVRDRLAGYLLLFGGAADFDDDDEIVLARASAVCALEMAKQEAVIEAEHRLRGDFFDDLLAENGDGSAESLIGRGRYLGYDLQQPHAVLAIKPDDAGQPADAAIAGLAREVNEYLTRRKVQGIVAPRPEAVAVFLALDTAEARTVNQGTVEKAAGLRDALSRQGAGSVTIGIGSEHAGILGLRVAFQEAAEAAEIGREIFGPGQVTPFADLGAYRLLYTFRGSPELASFCRETLAPLTSYDAKNHSSLVETLDAYFRHDASLGAAAEALHLHRNSLAYRLRRICELTGLDLDNLEDRFRLQLALKARRLVP